MIGIGLAYTDELETNEEALDGSMFDPIQSIGVIAEEEMRRRRDKMTGILIREIHEDGNLIQGGEIRYE